MSCTWTHQTRPPRFEVHFLGWVGRSHCVSIPPPLRQAERIYLIFSPLSLFIERLPCLSAAPPQRITCMLKHDGDNTRVTCRPTRSLPATKKPKRISLCSPWFDILLDQIQLQFTNLIRTQISFLLQNLVKFKHFIEKLFLIGLNIFTQSFSYTKRTSTIKIRKLIVPF